MNSQNNSKRNKQIKVASIAILSLITSIAMKCGEEDVSIVLGIVGSVIGASVTYVLPR